MNARITCKLVTFLCVLPQRLVINDNLLTMGYKIIFSFLSIQPTWWCYKSSTGRYSSEWVIHLSCVYGLQNISCSTQWMFLINKLMISKQVINIRAMFCKGFFSIVFVFYSLHTANVKLIQRFFLNKTPVHSLSHVNSFKIPFMDQIISVVSLLHVMMNFPLLAMPM